MYNGEVSWQEGVLAVNTSFKVPSEGFIPVLYYGTEEDVKSSEQNFDLAIEKCEVILVKHPNSKYVKNARFLIGRSLFYKRKFFLAIQNFEWVIKEYPDAKILPDCYIWLARTYYYNDRPTTAIKLIDEKIKKMDLTKKQKGELALLQATIELDNGEYDMATKILERNIRNQRGRLNRARVHFLLAQLYMKQGKMQRALAHFKKVTKINTDYELIFNAKLLAIRMEVGDGEGAEAKAKMQRALKRMLRDEKNMDYKDQIYYELALIDFKDDDLEAALKNLQLSVNVSTMNSRQKALSYYKAGQIYFYNMKEFALAQAKFDSAASTIDESAPEYKEIVTIGKTLGEYVDLVNTIQYQDSMLWLAGMSHNNLTRQIEKVIQEEKRKEDLKKQQERQEMFSNNADPSFMNQFNQQGGNQGNAGGGFYFNNQEQVSSGRVEFQAKWGNRKNEDNWRRKFKDLQIGRQEEEEETEEVDSALVAAYGDKAKYYKDIPQTDAEKDEAKTEVRSALFRLGQLFDKKLELPDSAIETYNKLIRRFPDSEDALKARFALYNLYSKIDPFKADAQKKYICDNHANSIYCKLIKGEDVQEELDAHLKQFESAYGALWPTYKKGDYQTVVTFSKFIIERYPDNMNIARVKYIQGLSYGEMGNLDSLKAVFMRTRDRHPDHEVTPIINRTLAKLGVAGQSNANVSRTPEDGPKTDPKNNPKFAGFKGEIKPNEKLFVIMLVDKDAITSNELKTKISDFNTAKFSSNKLTASIFFYKDQKHLGYISQFSSVKEALLYIDMVSKDEKLKEYIGGADDMIVFVTPTNFKVAYQQKRFEDYHEFFNQVILPSIE